MNRGKQGSLSDGKYSVCASVIVCLVVRGMTLGLQVARVFILFVSFIGIRDKSLAASYFMTKGNSFYSPGPLYFLIK